MAGTVGAVAILAVVLTAGVFPLTGQTVHLWEEQQIKRSTLFYRKEIGDFLMHLCSLDELLSGRFLVFFVAPPGSESRCLQGPAEGERQDPGFEQRAVVDGVEVDGGLLFALTSWEESNSCSGEEGEEFLLI